LFIAAVSAEAPREGKGREGKGREDKIRGGNSMMVMEGKQGMTMEGKGGERRGGKRYQIRALNSPSSKQ